MTPELQNQPEWKDWFSKLKNNSLHRFKRLICQILVLPYVKNPEENPTFKVHFTRQWQDTLLVSLHNFLATIFQVCLVFLQQEYVMNFYISVHATANLNEFRGRRFKDQETTGRE